MTTYFEILCAALPWSSPRRITICIVTCEECTSVWDEVAVVAGVVIIPLIMSGLVDLSQV